MYNFTAPVAKLIEELKKIPGIGQKSAQRIAFYLLKKEQQRSIDLAQALLDSREKTRFCQICYNISSRERCEICVNPRRDTGKICVVEEPFNIFSIERTNLYSGLYHVLHGNLSPISGIGPEELKIAPLERRLSDGNVEEVILATSPTTEGNATAHYLTEIIREYKIRVTRIALGLPVGADLDYVDSLTIARAIESRTDMS